jgi:hypothetical protein
VCNAASAANDICVGKVERIDGSWDWLDYRNLFTLHVEQGGFNENDGTKSLSQLSLSQQIPKEDPSKTCNEPGEVNKMRSVDCKMQDLYTLEQKVCL